MAVQPAGRRVPDTYLRLVKRFPLIHLRDEAHLDEALAVIDGLLRRDRDPGAQEYLDVLTDLVAAYEDEHVPMPDVSEADVLRELIRSHGLSQTELARTVGMAQSTISAVLTGARSLTKGQVLKLARFFGIGPAAFLPRPSGPGPGEGDAGGNPAARPAPRRSPRPTLTPSLVRRRRRVPSDPGPHG
jgi:HTH-type transcriptional regulator/antitoxin HigA